MAKERSRAGTYYRPHPLDMELLRRMPREGTTLGFHTLGLTVAHAKKELNKQVPEAAKLSSDMIHARLRSMRTAGLVKDVVVMGAGGSSGWQRTSKGEQLYTEQTGKTLSEADPELKVIQGGKA